ncbi:hypothetical protein TNCV_198171 [Trichonephila clavipes]|nr:hypothetical protein TNCV_198171 [Trichonephila clavipes]
MNSHTEMYEKLLTSREVEEFSTSEKVLPKKKTYFFKLSNQDLQFIPITDSIPSSNTILHQPKKAVPFFKISDNKNSSSQLDIYTLPNSDADMPEELSESNNITSTDVTKQYSLNKKISNATVAASENLSSDDIFIKDNYEDDVNNDNDYINTEGEVYTIGDV